MRIYHPSRQSKAGLSPVYPYDHRVGRSGNARSGAALIIALAILLVLLSLAITFFLIVRFETNMARQAYDRAQASHLLDAALAQAQYRLNRDVGAHGDVLSLDHGWRAWFSGASFVGKSWARNPNNPGLATISIEPVEQVLRGAAGENMLYAFFPRDRYLEPLFRGPRTEHWMHVPRKQGSWILLFAPASEMRLVNARGAYLDGNGNDFTVLNTALQNAGRPERFARWTAQDIKNGNRLPDDSYPEFITPAFFNTVAPDFNGGLPEEVINNTNAADVDSDGNGMKDAMWMPLSRDINHHGDGIDNDLDGNPDPLGPNGEPLFEAAPFVYHGFGLPAAAKYEDLDGLEALRSVPWTLRERLIDATNENFDNNGNLLVDGNDPAEDKLFLTVPLPGLVTQVDLNSDGIFDDRDHYRTEDVNGNGVDLGPLYVRLPDVLWVTVITGEDNTGTETYARAAVTINDVDVLDNDFDLIANNFRAYAYLGAIRPGYHNLNVDAICAEDGASGRQNLQFFCLRWNAPQGQYVQEAVIPDPNLIPINAVRVSCTGEAVSEITGRYALNIVDEASKVNLNTAGGYSTDASIDVLTGGRMQRALNRGVSPFEYETRLLPDLGIQRPLELWGMRTGTERPGYNDGGVDPAFLPDAWLPGYGYVDDDGDALLLSLGWRDDSGGGLRGEGLFPHTLSRFAAHYAEPALNGTNMNLLDELTPYPQLQRLLDYELASTRAPELYNRLGRFEGIDEPGELRLHNPLRNRYAENVTGESDLYSDRLLLRKESLQRHEEITPVRWEYLRNLVTVNSDTRNTFSAGGYGRDRDFLRVDPNYATPEQLAVNFILRGNISNIVDGLDTAGLADPLRGRYFAEGLRQFDTAFAGDLMGYVREMVGNEHRPGMRFPADPVLQTLRLAVDMAAARDRTHGRHKLVTENMLRNPDIYADAYASAGLGGAFNPPYEALNERERVPGNDLFPVGDIQEYFYDSLGIDFAAKRLIAPDLWWKAQTGEDRVVQHTAASLDAIRINEVMVRPVRRVEAETTPMIYQTSSPTFIGYPDPNDPKYGNLDPAPYPGLPVFDVAAFDAAGIEMGSATLGPWTMRSAYDTPAMSQPLLGDRTAWVHSYDPTAGMVDDGIIEFRFKATDGLPAGRYYLTVNLTDPYGRMSVTNPDVLQYAVRYKPFDPLAPPLENSITEDLAGLSALKARFYDVGLAFVGDGIQNLMDRCFQTVDQPEFLSTPAATAAGSGAAPGWAFLPVRSLEETYPFSENIYVTRYLEDLLGLPDDTLDDMTWTEVVTTYLLSSSGWVSTFFSTYPEITCAPDFSTITSWPQLINYITDPLSGCVIPDPKDPLDPTYDPVVDVPYATDRAWFDLFTELDTLYNPENGYYADGIYPAYPPPTSGQDTYTVIVPPEGTPLELCIALRPSPVPRVSFRTAVADWLNWYVNVYDGVNTNYTVFPPIPLTPAEYNYFETVFIHRVNVRTDILDPGLGGIFKPIPGFALGALPIAPQDWPTISVNFFDFSQEPSHEYLELANVSEDEVDVSGWRLEVGVPDPEGVKTNRYLEDPYKSVWKIPNGVRVAPGGHLLLGFDVFDGSQGYARSSESPLIGLNGMGLAQNDTVPADPTEPDLNRITVPPMADTILADSDLPPNGFGPLADLNEGSVFRRDNGQDYIDNDGDGLSSLPFVLGDSAAIETLVVYYLVDNGLDNTEENRRKARFEVLDTDDALAEFKTHGVSAGTTNNIPAWSRIVQLQNERLWRESVPGPWSEAFSEVPSEQEIYHYRLNPFTRNTRDITMADLNPSVEGTEAALGRLARLILRGGILPNYPERDGIDNDGDGGYVVDNDTGGLVHYFKNGPFLDATGAPSEPLEPLLNILNASYKEPLLSYVPGALDKDMIDNNLNYRVDERGTEIRWSLNGSPLDLFYRHGNPLRSEGVDEGRLGVPVYYEDSLFRGFPNLGSISPLPNFYGHGSYEAAPLPLFHMNNPVYVDRYKGVDGWLDEVIYGPPQLGYFCDIGAFDAGSGYYTLRFKGWTATYDLNGIVPEVGFPYAEYFSEAYANVVEYADSPVIADTGTDSPDWQAFVERRWNPGDNVIITLYAGDPLLKREADQVTYREYDVINRTLNDIAPSVYVIDGFSNYGVLTNPDSGKDFLAWLGPDLNDRYTGDLVCLDPPKTTTGVSYPGKPSFWLPDHMGLDFYRSLERKHPLYHGDRFGVANRWTATDGAYDDWADSLSVFQTGLGFVFTPDNPADINAVPGQVALYSENDDYINEYIAGDVDEDQSPVHLKDDRFLDTLGDDTATFTSTDYARQLFGHAVWGSPLRMNSQARLWENPADLGQLALKLQPWLNPEASGEHHLNLRYGRQFPGLDTYRNTGHALLQRQAEMAAAYPDLDPTTRQRLTERRPAVDWALRRATLPKAPFHTPGDILNLPSLSFERIIEGPEKHPGPYVAFGARYWPQYAVSPLNTRYFISESNNAYIPTLPNSTMLRVYNEPLSLYAYGYDRDLGSALASQTVWGGGASVLRGFAGLDADPVVETPLETMAMNPVVLTVGQARVVPLWPAPPDAREPGTNTFLDEDTHRALFRWPNSQTPPHHWTPVYLFELPMRSGGTVTTEQPWMQVRYPRRMSTPPMEYTLSRTDGTPLVAPVYLFNSMFMAGQLFNADISASGDLEFLADTFWPRWPVPTVASVTVNEFTSPAPSDRAALYISGHDPVAGEENRAEALFVWDRDDGLENGTYTAYIGTFIPGMSESLNRAHNLLMKAKSNTAMLLSGGPLAKKIRDWDPTHPETVGGYEGTRRFDPHLAFEFITDRRYAEQMLPEDADPAATPGLLHPRRWGQLGENTPGSKVYHANDDGYIFHSADPEMAWRAVPVRVTDNYLALRVRNMGEPYQIACISHVVLAPAPRTRGIVNINTAETRRVVRGVTGDNWHIELFNALMGLPGVVNALNPDRNRSLPPYKTEPLGLPEIVIPHTTPSDPDDPNSAPLDPWRQRWVTDVEKAFIDVTTGNTALGPLPPYIRDSISPALPALVRNSDTGTPQTWNKDLHGRAMTRLVSLISANRPEHPDGRYYTSPAELLKGIPGGGMVQADSPYTEVPTAPWPLSNRGTPLGATASGFGPRTMNVGGNPTLVGELYEQRYDDIVARFSQLANLVSTRSDVFEIILTVQSGSAYPDGGGVVDYRGDGFFPQAEQRARIIYDRRARTVRQDETGE